MLLTCRWFVPYVLAPSDRRKKHTQNHPCSVWSNSVSTSEWFYCQQIFSRHPITMSKRYGTVGIARPLSGSWRKPSSLRGTHRDKASRCNEQSVRRSGMSNEALLADMIMCDKRGRGLAPTGCVCDLPERPSLKEAVDVFGDPT